MPKYIGETEKDLARTFDLAGRNGWILLVDEGELLPVRRTGVSDAHDRYTCQVANFLLRRTEEFEDAVIPFRGLETDVDEACRAQRGLSHS